jgi:NADPH2 dehydrogenase
MFNPFDFNDLKLRNRIIAPPTKENLANNHGRVTAEMVRHYTNLARQGVGTLITESAYVAKQGRMSLNQLGISDEDQLEGLGKLTKSVKKEGACIGVRLAHAGAKTSEELCGENPVGPSMYNFGRDYDVSREFDEGDIEEIVLHFVHAAERAQEVGMDFLEINGADQLLLDQCFSMRYNNRDDDYGAQTVQSRLRLACQIIRAIRDRNSVTIPISYYFTIFDKLEDGFSPEDLEATVNMLEESGVDLFHPLAVHVMNRCFDSEESLLEWIGRFTDKSLIAEGNIKSPQVLLEVLSMEKATWYVLEKSLFVRPNWYQFLKKKVTAEKEK